MMEKADREIARGEAERAKGEADRARTTAEANERNGGAPYVESR